MIRFLLKAERKKKYLAWEFSKLIYKWKTCKGLKNYQVPIGIYKNKQGTRLQMKEVLI